MDSLNVVLAQAGGSQPGGLGMMVPILLMLGIFYFMMIRPQQRKEKERQKQISELRAGQRVLFGGGFIGKVVECKDHTFMVEIAHGVNVEIARGAITRTLVDGEMIKTDPA
jgi:preprotein translocase subunit YajC